MSASPGSVTSFTAAYGAWDAKRKELSAQEETATAPDPDAWAASDDEAAELLHDAMSLINELTGGPLA